MAGYAFGNGLTLDPGAEIQAGIEKGKQTALGRLLGQSFTASPEDRQTLLGQAAQIDAGKAMQAQKSFTELDDDTIKSTAQRLAMASAAWKAGNKDVAQGFYTQAMPGLRSMSGVSSLPPQMDDQAAAAFDKLVGAISGKAGAAAEAYTLTPGAQRFDANNRLVASVPVNDKPQNATFQVDAQGRGWWLRPGEAPIPADMPGSAAPQDGASGQLMGDALTNAVQQVESGGNPFAVSPKGAVGSMQTMPTTLTSPGFNIAPARDGSPQEQARVGRDYLQAMVQKYGPVGGLAAYNWGPGNWEAALTKYGSPEAALAHAPAETQAYVPKVLAQARGSAGGIQFKTPKQGGDNAPSGYRFTADGARLEPIPGGPADTGGDYQLSKDAVSNAAWDFIMTGTKPQFARSHEGDKQRIAIQNEVANIAKQAGVSPQELSTQKGKYKALQTSLANTQKMSDTMDRQTETFHRNADLMLNLSANVPRTNMPGLNRYLLDFNLKWKGDPATAAYISAARTAINEYAKIGSGATGASGSTDASRREAQEAISAASTPQQLAQVIATLKQDAENQRNATHDQLITISSRMAQFGNKGAAAPANNDPLGILGK